MVATYYYKKKQRNVAKKALKNNYNFSGKQKKPEKASMLIIDIEIFSKKMNLTKKKKKKHLYGQE